MLLSMKRLKGPRPPGMLDQVEQFMDVVYWTVSRRLDKQGITTLHWAIMQHGYRNGGRVGFTQVFKATGESKSNVRRAAKFLEISGLGIVSVDPSDKRARVFSLSARGTRKTSQIRAEIESDLLKLIGAREVVSQRVREFTKHLWHASGFIPPGDLTNLSQYKKAELPDNSPRFVPDTAAARPSAATSDEMPW